MNGPKILIVDDEEAIRELVGMYLQKEGFTVINAADGEEALAKTRETGPDLIILDIMLPKKDGWDVCREIRRTHTTPIIMLTAKDAEYDRILGLELGADDYLVKPFSPRELVARVKAVLRRTQSGPGSDEILSYPELTINRAAMTVELNQQPVNLTPKEFELLWFLASHPGRVFSRDQLLSRVWNYDYFGDPRTVDTHIKRLREKLRTPTGTGYIKTVWGRGYKFEVSR
ncbi:MAG: response regulator transcription factor [Peptococcaceae bacterium]|nr:response regulator transcription factor [Peptococcaceae bacterium]